MKRKDVIILAVVFSALLLMVLGKNLFMKPPVEVAEYKDFKVSFEPGRIYRVELKNLSNNSFFNLKREGEGWIIPSRWNAPGDKQLIETLIEQIRQLKGEIRSASRDLFDDYGIRDDQALSIVLFDKEGKAQETLLVGIEVPAGGGACFVRKAGQSTVYLVDHDIFSLLGARRSLDQGVLEVDRWVDVSLAEIDAGAVKALKITRAGEERPAVDIRKELDEENNLERWVRKDSNVRKAAPRRRRVEPELKPERGLDAEKIKNFIEELNYLRADKVTNPQGDWELDNPFLRVTLETEEWPLEFVIGKERRAGRGDRYLRVPAGHVYIARQNVIDKLNKNIEDFLADEAQEQAQEE